jgi:Kdo2-lipid IVA lauroyltransferase/acyltransferase
MSGGFSSDIGIFFLKKLARLPFWLIYLFSDILFVLIYYLIGYRRKVVHENLQNAFPEKTQSETKRIARRFYRHFCDLTLEIIKLGRMNEAEFRKRMTIQNMELLNHFFNQGKSLIMLTMHYNNWEWSSCIPLYMKHKPVGVYKPLHNKKYDEYINHNRERMGVRMISNNMVLRQVVKAQKNEEKIILWLAGDQTPPVFHKFWLLFLNQEAMFYQGPAAISRRFNFPVIFQKIVKKERGMYETSFEVLIENPVNFSEAEIMQAYIKRMEEIIREQPEFYLWSHKRWKHKRPENVPLNG